MSLDPIEAADRIRDGKLRTGSYDVCLDPDLVDEYEALTARRDAALASNRDSLAGGAAVELDQQIADVLEQIRAATLTLRFQALSRPRFRQLVDAYPPRLDEDGKLTKSSDVIGVNFDAFFERIIPLSLIDPKLDPDTLKLLLDEHVTDRGYQELTDVVWDLNRGRVNLPFSSSGSATTRDFSPR